MDDAYNLQRFVDAQNPVFAQVCAELRAGQKTSHWMWFIFPQIAGLGSSSLARKYAISSLDEAKAYLNHSVLGPRIKECTLLVLSIEGRTMGEIFGTPDDLKFRSSLTLFVHAEPAERLFQDALRKYFGGEEDSLTVARLMRDSKEK
jgi:uncharacterized protein (DUF1810 family)